MKKIITLLSIVWFFNQNVMAQNPYPLVGLDTTQKVSASRLAADTTIPDYISPMKMNATYGDTVQIEGVVTFDPHYYGLSVRRKSAFIQTAMSGEWQGVEVMLDSTVYAAGQRPTLKDFNNNIKFYDNFQPGLTVRVTGIISNFPATNSKTGHTQLLLLNWETTITNATTQTITPKKVTVDMFMKNNGGTQVWQPTTGEAWEGIYVELDGVKVVDISAGTGANTGRWFWTLADNVGNKIRVRDYSAWFRNDHFCDCTLPNGYSFTPPKGFRDDMRGVIVENITAGVSEYMFAPLTPADTGLSTSSIPPSIRLNSRTPMIPTSSQAVTISATITDDSAVTYANLHYAVGYSNTVFNTVAMTANGNIYTADIPAQADGSFVKFWIDAADSSSNITYYPDTFATASDYMVLDQGITKISDIQMTPYANGNSMWANDYLPMNIYGVVVSTSLTDDLGEVVLQNGSAPWSGIILRGAVSDGLNGLKRGDSVNITNARVRESFGLTILDSLKSNYTIVNTNQPLPAFNLLPLDSITANISAYTEPYEAMLVKFDSVYVVNLNPDAPGQFGEWSVGHDTLMTAGLRVDDKCGELNNSGFNVDSLALKQVMGFVQGVLGYANNNFKLWPRNKKDLDLTNLPDKTPPVITLNGKQQDSLQMNKKYTDLGATALDNKDGDITSKITMTSNLDSSKTGAYSICYNVIDAAGNAANQACRTVIVYKNAGINLVENRLGLTIYPSPASDVLNINTTKVCQLYIYDLTGKLVRFIGTSNTGSQSISLNGLANGTYIIQGISDNVSQNIRFEIIK